MAVVDLSEIREEILRAFARELPHAASALGIRIQCSSFLPEGMSILMGPRPEAVVVLKSVVPAEPPRRLDRRLEF